MDKKRVALILSICALLLSIAGAVFLCVSILGRSSDSELNYAFTSILLAGIFDLIRMRVSNRDKSDE